MAHTISAQTIITSHANADFDALAAMVAASKLYPGATLIFPGSQEKNLRNFFIQSATYLFNFRSGKDIDPASVKQVVVVDTRQKSRVSHIKEILDRPGLVIHTYDHHPNTDEDLKADSEVVLPWGSTTAILVDRIKQTDVRLDPDEATIMGLGIYEDTGSFTFNSTTSHDLEAAAWLKTQGMDLNVISDLISRELSSEQVSILNSLIESASTYEINSIEIVVAEVSTEQYISDFALLAHKLMDMENIRVLFALGRMSDRIHLVARSKSPEVDVGVICDHFGGGGHAYAASASIKDLTLAQVKDELFALLYSLINPQLVVGKLMSRPVVSVPDDSTIAGAVEIMTRYGLKALPVLDADGKCVGILDHHLADKAMSHGLGDIALAEYMQRDFLTVMPDTDLYRAMEIILGHRQRLVPVVENDLMVGVITRTDLINILIKEPARIPESLLHEKRRERSIAQILRDRLPRDMYHVLLLARDMARDLGYQVYAVGGFVRDILLLRANLDLDLVVEGDGIRFAESLAAQLGGRAKTHSKFKTAVIILPNGKRIDVATARLEYYEYPAALPTVELSSIKMDLYRRDFTINALAVHLNPEAFGKLVDFFGAQRDIKDRIIRVLHSLSFVEDPTRILRAIRFEQRFSFRIDAQTERLIRNAIQLGLIAKLSGTRLFHEMKLICDEGNALACFKRMQQFKLLGAIHPLLSMDQNREAILEELEKVMNWYRLLYLEPKPEPWKLYLLGLTVGCDTDQTESVIERLNFSKRAEREFVGLRQSLREVIGKVLQWQYNNGPLSELYFILEDIPVEGSLYLMARSQKESVRKNVSLFLTQLRHQKIDIAGQDLKELGLEPGPAYGEILTKVKAAKIDGLANCRSTQLEYAAVLVDEAKGAAPALLGRVIKDEEASGGQGE